MQWIRTHLSHTHAHTHTHTRISSAGTRYTTYTQIRSTLFTQFARMHIHFALRACTHIHTHTRARAHTHTHTHIHIHILVLMPSNEDSDIWLANEDACVRRHRQTVDTLCVKLRTPNLCVTFQRWTVLFSFFFQYPYICKSRQFATVCTYLVHGLSSIAMLSSVW